MLYIGADINLSNILSEAHGLSAVKFKKNILMEKQNNNNGNG